jgi:pimeloyl-ACP methyl ester carboxylesterase
MSATPDRFSRTFVFALLFFLMGGALALPVQDSLPASRLKLKTFLDEATRTPVRRGTYRVHENRATRTGRVIDLHIVVLPATGEDPRPDPIFWLAGGPGVAATGQAGGLARSWMREDRDIVLVDQRGTGRSNPLRIRLAGSDENLQGYLDPIFKPEIFQTGLAEVEKKADPALYTTPIAMDDLNEIRAVLGYEKINLMGGSYGTRAALVYLRRHRETVRCAVLNGVAPIAFKNPLYHAQAAQEGFDRICAEVAADPVCRKAFPGLKRKLWSLLHRLEAEPVEVAVRHPATGESVTIRLTRTAFAEALRVMMYYLDTNRKVPLCILKAYGGDFEPFGTLGISSNRRIRNLIAFGMLMCVTGSEDIPRIDPDSIPRLTRGTFLGDGRVHRQMAVAAFWPRGNVPSDYGEPVRSDVPVLLLSGTHDPVTPPRFGEEAARHLENSLHLVVPGAHGVGGPVIERIVREFLSKGTIEGLDTSGIEQIRLPPFALPEQDGSRD